MKTNPDALTLLRDFLYEGKEFPKSELVELERRDLEKAFYLLDDSRSLTYGERQWYLTQVKQYPKCVEAGYEGFSFIKQFKKDLLGGKDESGRKCLTTRLNKTFPEFELVDVLGTVWAKIKKFQAAKSITDPLRNLLVSIESIEQIKGEVASELKETKLV